jgi:Uma2 family endonuclease
VPEVDESWTLSEETMPESQTHDIALDLLKALLLAWVARANMNAQVARNLAVRWDASRPQIGVDPDLCVLSPRTPEGASLLSVCTWREGHTPPLLAIEVVSENHPRKDYVDAPARYAASGTKELWIFDPRLAGPRIHGGPFRLQVWRRSDDDELKQIYAGPGPAWSPTIGAWLTAVDEGQRLRIADDEAGTKWWTTAEEAERTAKEAALARVAELEAELRKLRGEGS